MVVGYWEGAGGLEEPYVEKPLTLICLRLLDLSFANWCEKNQPCRVQRWELLLGAVWA